MSGWIAVRRLRRLHHRWQYVFRRPHDLWRHLEKNLQVLRVFVYHRSAVSFLLPSRLFSIRMQPMGEGFLPLQCRWSLCCGESSGGHALRGAVRLHCQQLPIWILLQSCRTEYLSAVQNQSGLQYLSAGRNYRYVLLDRGGMQRERRLQTIGLLHAGAGGNLQNAYARRKIRIGALHVQRFLRGSAALR